MAHAIADIIWVVVIILLWEFFGRDFVKWDGFGAPFRDKRRAEEAEKRIAELEAETGRLRDALGVIARNVDAGAVHTSWCSDYSKRVLAYKRGTTDGQDDWNTDSNANQPRPEDIGPQPKKPPFTDASGSY